MAYVPGFDHDLFISYATADNVDGWVDQFDKLLTEELARQLGHPVSHKLAFFDKRHLTVGQHYPESLDRAVRSSALLVTLISPSYANSEWCTRERREFQQRLPPGASFLDCLIAVKLRPVTGPLPDVFQNAQHFTFLPDGGFAEPFAPQHVQWPDLVKRLASQIRPILEKHRNRAPAVYVGATLATHMDLRKNVTTFLAEKGYRAVPDLVAQLEDPALRQSAMAEATCAVHFTGGALDHALDAIEESVSLGKKTILWSPVGAKETAAEETFFLGLTPYPHRLPAVESNFQHDLLELLASERPAVPTTGELVLVCEKADSAWAQSFPAAGMSISCPLVDEKTRSGAIRELKRAFRDGHGLLFFQGQSSEQQLSALSRMADEEKATNLRRWYLADPHLLDKKAQHPDRPVWADGLEQFLDEVKQRANAQ